jgi:nucleoside-diphosphate-sugar epimerase
MLNFLTYYGPDPEGNIRLPLGDARVSYIDARDVADVAAEVLTAEDHVGKAYTLTGPEAITVDEIASAISAATGRSITYVDMPEEATRQGMHAQGTPSPMVDGILDLFSTNKAGKAAVVTDEVRAITGRPPRSFKEFARDHAEGWKPG